MGEIHQLSVDSQHNCVYIWERSTNYQWIPSMIVSIYGRDPPTISGFPALLCLYMGEIHQLSVDSQHDCVYIWERSTNYQWIPSIIVSIYGRDPPTISGFPALLCLYMGEIHQLSVDSQHNCVYIWERSTNYQWIPSIIVSIYGRDPPTISGFPA